MSEILAVYADGGVLGRNPSPVGATWAWLHVSTDLLTVPDPEPYLCRRASGLLLPVVSGGDYSLGAETTRNVQARISPVSNNHSEFVALLECLKALPDGWEGRVYSDSLITLGRFFQGWRLENIPRDWHEAMLTHADRLGKVRWMLLDGHPTRAQLAAERGKCGNPVSSFNVWCDLECGRLAKAYLDHELPPAPKLPRPLSPTSPHII